MKEGIGSNTIKLLDNIPTRCYCISKAPCGSVHVFCGNAINVFNHIFVTETPIVLEVQVILRNKMEWMNSEDELN